MLGTHEPTELWWNKAVIYWHENQSAITFHSSLDPTQLPEHILESLHLDRLNQFLNKNGFNLKSFGSKDIPGPSQPPIPVQSPDQGVTGTIVEKGIELIEKGVKAVEEVVSKSDSVEKPLEPSSADDDNASRVSASESGGQKWDDEEDNDKDDDGDGNGENGINSPVGKYLFGSPSGHGTIVIGFFHVTPTSKTPPSSGMMGMGTSSGNNSVTSDTTQSLVNLINRNLDKLRQDGDIPLVAAMPNWLNGATQDFVSHGCPIVPPIPIQAEEACATNTDNWPITLPQLSSTMQGMTGEGVTVFVLDTIPTRAQIEAATSSAGGNNKLLQSLVAKIEAGSIIINHQRVPSRVGNRIVTGKDVYQRLFGFRMPDHGLFVAGIIQDLAHDANIECIRVLNNFGMGDVNIIIAALQNIYNRMQEGGDLHDRQVVINMSLVATPADEELPSLWFGDDCCCHAEDIAQMMYELKLLRDSLHLVIQSLTAAGAVVVASAGNDSDFNIGSASMASYMNVGMGMPSRWRTRYPAAFPEVISVGAVDNSQEASQYSNFPALPPQHNGIATYGGGIPTPLPFGSPIPPSVINPPPGAKTWAIVTDAVRGIYSSTHYSELSATDLPPAEYSAPTNNNAWAYWSGTSFATPIISAVAARVLQRLSAGAVPIPIDQLSAKVQWAIINADGQRTLLTDSSTALPANSLFGPSVSILKAEQVCQPSKG